MVNKTILGLDTVQWNSYLTWGVLGWILDLPEGTKRNHIFPFGEVQFSFGEIQVFKELCRPSSIFFRYYIFCVGKLRTTGNL